MLVQQPLFAIIELEKICDKSILRSDEDVER